MSGVPRNECPGGHFFQGDSHASDTVSIWIAVASEETPLVILPATNAKAERSFSALRRIKSYLMQVHTMSQARLNHLIVYYIITDIFE